MQKFLLSLMLISALVANFDDRKGEDFETSIGTVHRSSTKLFLTEPDGMTVYKMKKSNPIMFKAGSTIGGIVLKKRLLISHAMTREELVMALADYIENPLQNP